MKVIWEPHDIRCGRRVGKSERTEQWIIGYVPGQKPKFAIISCDDGMICKMGLTAAEIAAHLNESEELPVELLNRFRATPATVTDERDI